MSPFRASAPLTDDWRQFRFSVADGVGTLVLDRSGTLNALTFEAYADLRDLLSELPRRGDVRVLVVRGAMTQALLMKGQDYAEFHAACTEGRQPRRQPRRQGR